jgi:dihydropteroate synthase
LNAQDLGSWLQSYIPGAKITPLVMGILNVTPDSFSDGGNYLQLDAAMRQVELMLDSGVDIIDIGGESTRPSAIAVSVDEELARVLPVIEKIRSYSDIAISIDTSKVPVMQEAVHLGASMINDVNALQAEGALDLIAALQVPTCLMHMQGMPANMQDKPYYNAGVIPTIMNFFKDRIDSCVAAGINRQLLILDPGFGFGKSTQDNLLLVKHFADFLSYNLPVLLGVSRKTSIASILSDNLQARIAGSLALTIMAALEGMSIVRTHDVLVTKQVLTMMSAVRELESNFGKS